MSAQTVAIVTAISIHRSQFSMVFSLIFDRVYKV